MAQKKFEKSFHTLADLKTQWPVRQSDLQQWLTQGHLTAHIWLPVMSVFERDDADRQRPLKLQHWEGYIPLSRHQCHRLFRQGFIRLREFANSDHTKKFMLPETADEISASFDDLVILEREWARFGQEYRFEDKGKPLVGSNDETLTPLPHFDPTFKIVRFAGKTTSFGPAQANVLRLLYESAMNGQPWQCGKRLLQAAGSKSFTLSNLFTRKDWRHLITSKGDGEYRLDEKFFAALMKSQSR